MRSRAETITALNTQLDRAVKGAPSAVAELSTATGIKDKYFLHFVGILQEAVSKFRDERRGTSRRDEQVQTFLGSLRQTLPDNLFSPVLEIPGMDQ